MELTKEYFDKWLGQLATKENITELKTEIKDIKETLNAHTLALDALVKQTKDWNTEMAVVRGRLDKHDSWFKILSEKTGAALPN